MLSRPYTRLIQTITFRYTILYVILATGCATTSLIDSPTREHSKPMTYVFGWLDYPYEGKPLRGGKTTGIPVVLDTLPSPAWSSLRKPDQSTMDRDQSAIRALAGDYKVSFDFLETVVFDPRGHPSQPYRSWGTERIYLIEDRPGLVELQHILVMFTMDDQDVIRGPMVMKHWRQRWEFEPNNMHVYVGHRIWENRPITEERRTNKWLQTVYQVDDTPRYALLGEWQHHVTHSLWLSTAGYRPLPRREYSVRKDYHVLDGTNRITVLPNGWVHEQDNLKRVLNTERSNEENIFVARELGINRYERITDFDFSAGDEYWSQTASYWALVRQQVDARISDSERIRFKSKCDGKSAFGIFFEQAYEFQTEQNPHSTVSVEKIESLLDCLISTVNPY